MFMAILNLRPFGQFECKRRLPESPEPPPPSSPEDVFRYERAPRIPKQRDASATSGPCSQGDGHRSLRLTSASTAAPINLHDEPPPYSLLAPKAHTASSEAPELPSLLLENPAQIRRIRAMKQLNQYLIEIIALTVRVVFDQLNIALGAKGHSTGTVSILSNDERRSLPKLSCVTSKTAELSAAGLPIDLRDEQILREAFDRPSALRLDYISNYKDLVAKPGDWTQTLPGYWAKAHETTKTSPKAEDSTRSLELLIGYVSEPNDGHKILMEALEATRVTMWLGVPDPRYASYPTRKGYGELRDKPNPPQSRTHVWS